jgi:peptidoglycan/LPS O-acetylase OafA/YrhL
MKAVKQIYPLTSLRFFAAVFVVLHHTIEAIYPAITLPGWQNRLQQYSGVTVLLFFILSGYVLAIAYLEEGRTVERKRFWIARFARIYPLYFVTLVDAPNLYHYRLLKYGAKAALLKTSISFAGSTLLLQQWFPRLRGIDFPNWSLCVEALFYLLFPFVGSQLWRLRLATQCNLALALFFTLFGIQYVGGRWGIDPFAYLQPVSSLPYFVAGIVLRRIQLWIRQDTIRFARWQLASPWLALLIVAVLAIACASPRKIDTAIVPGLLFLPGFSLLLLCFSGGNRRMEAAFSRPTLVLLGESSYSLYLLHMIVWAWFFAYARLPLNVATYFLYLAAAILLSIASFRFLEVPARRRILRAWQQRSPESEVVASLAQ